MVESSIVCLIALWCTAVCSSLISYFNSSILSLLSCSAKIISSRSTARTMSDSVVCNSKQSIIGTQQDALPLPSHVHCLSQVGYIGRVLVRSVAVNANRAYLLLLEADPPPFGLEAVRSEKELKLKRDDLQYSSVRIGKRSTGPPMMSTVIIKKVG
jgi:hypothetical protein